MAVQIVRANAQDDLPTEWTLVGWSDVVHECGCDWVDEPNRQARSMTEVAAEDNEVDVVFGRVLEHVDHLRDHRHTVVIEPVRGCVDVEVQIGREQDVYALISPAGIISLVYQSKVLLRPSRVFTDAISSTSSAMIRSGR